MRAAEVKGHWLLKDSWYWMSDNMLNRKWPRVASNTNNPADYKDDQWEEAHGVNRRKPSLRMQPWFKNNQFN